MVCTRDNRLGGAGSGARTGGGCDDDDGVYSFSKTTLWEMSELREARRSRAEWMLELRPGVLSSGGKNSLPGQRREDCGRAPRQKGGKTTKAEPQPAPGEQAPPQDSKRADLARAEWKPGWKRGAARRHSPLGPPPLAKTGEQP